MYAKYYIKMDHKHTYKFYTKHCFFMLKITNILLVRNLVVIYENFSVLGICGYGNYARK